MNTATSQAFDLLIPIRDVFSDFPCISAGKRATRNSIGLTCGHCCISSQPQGKLNFRLCERDSCHTAKIITSVFGSERRMMLYELKLTSYELKKGLDKGFKICQSYKEYDDE